MTAMSLALVPLENLRRSVLGAVVGRDDEVNACIEMKRELRIEDVRGVATEERHNELHDGILPRTAADVP